MAGWPEVEMQSQIEMTAPNPVPSAGSLYAEHVNPQWVRLLDLFR